MEREINFVQGRRKKLTKSQKVDLKIFKGVLGVFGVFVAIFLITLGVDFYLQFQVKSAKDQQKQMERQVAAQESIEQSIVITTEKLKILSELFELRYDKQAAIDFFSEIFGSQVLIKDINYEAGERILSLRLQSPSIFILESVFEELSNPEVEEQFGQVNKTDLVRNDRGGYNMAITLSLVEESKTKKK
ncbi:MAG: hypothetical protein OEX81_03785 [Candidatus Pacebacteria bacterium]|nr:hypothetical protein [Candidatus Paceibacterota bacterium]